MHKSRATVKCYLKKRNWCMGSLNMYALPKYEEYFHSKYAELCMNN